MQFKKSSFGLLFCSLILGIVSILSAQISFVDHDVATDFSQCMTAHAGDINNDGFMDIIGGSRNDKISWLENDGAKHQRFTGWTPGVYPRPGNDLFSGRHGSGKSQIEIRK